MPNPLSAILPARWTKSGPIVPVVPLIGAIGDMGGLGSRRSLTLRAVAAPLARAFAIEKAPAVAILVNSPGGSAVQSHLIHRRIRAHAEETGKPVLAFVEDLAASGGYMIACAGDEIFADPSSILGSIGVVSAGFGFNGLIERIGVERRIHTAGDNKAFLDPFRPEREEDVARLRAIQDDIHAQFVALVRARRGGRLADAPDLFGGLVWSGREAEALGLVDGLGEVRGVLRQRFGAEVRPRVIEPSRGSFLRRMLFGSAAAAAEGALAAAGERALWARHGL